MMTPSRMRICRWLLTWAVCVLGSAVSVEAVRAENLDKQDFTVRLPAALTRFASYADVAGAGGASAASMWSSAINPASLAWRPCQGHYGCSASPQWARIKFREGARLDVFSEAVTQDFGEWGVFQPALAQVRSNEETTRAGYDFGMDLDMFQMNWGKRISDTWAIGAGVSFSESETVTEIADMRYTESRSETYGFRAGVLHEPVDHLRTGVVFDYAFSPARTTMFDIFGLGTGNVRTDDVTHQFSLRPGVSWEYKPESSICVDYQYVNVGNQVDSLHTNRFYMGIDHEVVDGFYARGGTTLDTAGNTSWTAGIGVYPCDWFALDAAFQSNMFPELEPEFGRSWTVVLSMSITL